MTSMMNTRIIILLVSLLTLVSAEDIIQKDTWLQGCYDDGGTSDQWQTVNLTLVPCAKRCLQQGWQFAAVHLGVDCACLNETTPLLDVSKDSCNHRCPDLEDVRLPCGAVAAHSRLWSLYRVDGPYLQEVNASIPGTWVVSGVPVALQASAVLSRHSNLTDTIDSENWANNITFEWSAAGQQTSSQLPATGRVTSASVPFIFPHPGNFTVDVRVRNDLSVVHAQLPVTVVTPRPRGLQLLPSHRDSFEVPSCVHPSKDTSNGEEEGTAGQPLVRVFAGTTLEVEPDLSTGVNVTFVFVLSDSRKSQVHKSVVQSVACWTTKCQDIKKTLVFPQVGQYLLHVNASNQYGWDSRSLRVVAVDRRLGQARLTLQDAAHAHWPTGKPLSFRLAVHTTDRHNTYLRVDFGDGEVRTASLRETAEAETELVRARRHAEECGEEGCKRREVVDLDGMKEGMEGLRLVADYGDGCELVAVFQHTYRTEGVFAPRVWVDNNITQVTQVLAEPVLLLHHLSVDTLQAPEVLATGTTAEFVLHLLPPSPSFVHLSSHWLISDSSDVIIANLTTTSTALTWSFPRPGVFSVKVVASNPLNSVTASASLVVLESVEGLSLRCEPDPPHLTVEQELHCQAELSRGSDLNISWDFQDSSSETDVETAGLVSKATHMYTRPGGFNVTVQASNLVSEPVIHLQMVTVDAPVQCLRLETSAPATPGEKIFLVATAVGGTAVNFDFDWGKGRKSWEGETEVVRARTSVGTSVQFSRPGVHNITLYAHNPVSHKSLTTHLVVQQPVPDLELVPHRIIPAPNGSAIFFVQQKGKLTERQDLLYQLDFSDGGRIVSRSPVLEKLFTYNGNYSVNFTASSEVSTYRQWLNLEVDTSDELYGKPRLQHSTIVFQNRPVVFQILDFPSDVGKIEVHYSNDRTKVLRGGLHVWNHVFQNPGVHTVEVAIYGKRRGGVQRSGPTLRSVLVVQQPIRGLQLAGPAHVGIHCHNVWKIQVSQGSHLVCQWSLDEEHEEHFTSVLVRQMGFTAAGAYTLGVHCHNDISHMSASINVTVSHPVSDVHLSVPVMVRGQNTTFTVTVFAGSYFSLHCDYGDGTKEQFVSRQMQLVNVEPQIPEWLEPVPAYNITLSHSYSNVGAYNIMVTVFNDISVLSRRTIVRVEEAIGEIYMEVRPSGIISLSETVHVAAVVSAGDNLQFEWDFSGDFMLPSISSKGNTSVAAKPFSKAGEYNVVVKVTNHLQREPVVASLPFPIIVQEPVVEVMLVQVGTPGANFSLLTNLSDEVVFEAKSAGNPVRFVFSFGDGHIQEVEGSLNMMSIMEAKVIHRYTSEGVYTVMVTASNDLGNATAFLPYPLYVQVPVQGQLLNSINFCSHYGEEITLTASPTEGTNVTYRWRLDDETELVNTNGTVRHKYQQPGSETIEVTASNNVSSVTSYAFVEVVEQIQSVSLHVESLIVALNEVVEFKAIVMPERNGESARYFVWNTNGVDAGQSKEPRRSHQFSRSGFYTVFVKAFNCYSNATSIPVTIHVVSPLVDLAIEVVGDYLAGKLMKFTADHYQGDYLNFTWNFGDNSAPLFTDKTAVWYTYNRTGEYMVTLLAKNPLGHKEVTRTVFILTHVCRPPSVKIIGLEQVMRWQQLHVESQVTVNCSVTNNILYTWKVIQQNNDESGEDMRTLLLNSPQAALTYPDLIIPAHILPLGHYKLSLTVTMNGTEIPVYQEATTSVNVVKSPLVSHILGGIMRLYSQQSVVTLDGSQSHNPDDADALLSYQWGCQVLEEKNISCFNQSSADQIPSLNSSSLQFPATMLRMDRKYFLFNLTVHSPASHPVNSTQVIELNNINHIIPVGIHCRNCQRMLVNSNDKLSLTAVCGHDTCTGKHLHYRWEVFIVGGDNSGHAYDMEGKHVCQQADRTIFQKQVLQSTNTSTTTTTTSTASTTTASTTTTSKSTTALLSVGNTSELQSRHQLPKDRFRGLPDILAPSEGRIWAARGYDNSRRIQTSRISDRLPLPSVDIAEGTAGDRKLVPRVEELTTPLPCSPVDCVQVNPVRPASPPPHIITKKRLTVELPASSLMSEVDSPALVLRPGTLTPGRTYLVKLTVSSDDDPEATGEAMTSFEVNRAPSKGTCSVVPETGVEMETVFRVFCKEWQDEEKNLPLWYRVSYSLGVKDDASAGGGNLNRLLYHGLSHQVAFRLPAGLPHSDNRVLLQLSVEDNLGAATIICHIPIQVRPQLHTNATVSAEPAIHKLKDDVERLSAGVSSSLFYGDVSGVEDTRDVLSNVAVRLNRLEEHRGSEETIEDIREHLLLALEKLPVRDEVELIKTLQCLLYVTHVISQVNGEMLVRARGQLENAAQRVQVMYKGQGGSDRDVLPLAVQVVSNLLQVATRGKLLQEGDLATRQRVSAHAIGVLHDLLRVVLQDHTLGELPVQYTTDFLTTIAAHYNTFSAAAGNISDVSFRLPPGLADSRANTSISDSTSSSPRSQCMQVHSMVFRQSPFPSHHAPRPDVQSQVVGFDVFTCDAQQRRLVVEGLNAEDGVQITLPVTEKQVAVERHLRLQRDRMNIHQFNVSQTHKNMYLSLLVTLDPIATDARAFPITAVISQHWPPHPENCLYRRNFPLDTDQLRLFFPPGFLNGTGTFYLGLVETSLNSGRHRKTEVTMRHYAFSAWFSTCLFWNESESQWSSTGCQPMATTTPQAAQCSCTHLTSFGSHFELIPNDLSFSDVECFFSLHKNPVVVVLVSVVVAVYTMLLVVAWRADRHDARKGHLVCLADNNVTDTQLYEVIIHTGLRQSGPTTAKISIILHGEYGMSETRELISDDDRPVFESNSRDRFLLTLPDSLGRIVKVQLWHNNAGPAPRWFLSQILVRDLNSGKVYYFLCNSWFAVDEGDGRVEREFVALEGNVGFMQTVLIKGCQYMWDFHLWASVATCPPHSCFTHVQRLTCCLTVLLSYMALNATWYQHQPEQRRGEFGLLDVSWQTAAVGGICCCIVLPFSLFLAFLFRCSRVSHTSCGHRGDSSTRNTTLGTTTTLTASGGGLGNGVGEDVAVSSPSVTYSLLDQSILNWQSIQGWAQRQWVKRQQPSQSSAISVKNNAQPPTQPCPTQPVQQTLHAGDETDQASSGFEDAVSQVTAERNRIKATSDTSSDGHSPIAHRERNGRRIYLPSWCRYLAFILCALVCAGSGTITILYGFRFGPVKSMQWLQSLYFSFTICVFLAQPFWIILTAIYVAIRNCENPAKLDYYEDEEEAREGIEIWHSHQKQALDSSEDEFERGVRARQRSRYLRFSRPPQEKRLQESRKRIMKEKKAAGFLREFTMFVAMFTLVCVMAYGKDLSSHYLLNSSLEALFLKTRPQAFHTITSIKDWYQWAQGSLLEGLYGTYSSPGLANKGGLDYSYFLIGQPHIRQLREQPLPCRSVPYLPDYALCHPRHKQLHASKDTHQWSPAPPGGSLTWGHLGVYEAGGYSVHFNHSSKEEAHAHLKNLASNGWLDERTRAVVVELTVLNVPLNLFSSVVFLLELPVTGSAVPSFKIMSTCLFRYITAWDNCVLACELLFILVALVCLQRQLAAIVEQGRQYFLWPWNYTHMALCLVSVTFVACYIYRFLLVSDMLEYMRSSFFEHFVSLAFITLWDELMRSLVGMLVFLVVITKGLCLMQYWSPMAKFTAVYRRVRREVLLMCLLFFGIVMAFSALGTAVFGAFTYGMRSFWSASCTVVALATGFYQQQELPLEMSMWYSVFSLFFSLIGSGLIISYAVAVFTHRLRVYKSTEVVVISCKDLTDYCRQWMTFLFSDRLVIPVHEPQVDLPPECTLAEFEYQVEELLFRMNALAGTTNLPEKPTGYLTDSDQSHANGDDGISSGESETVQEHSAAAIGEQGCETGVAGEERGRLEQRVQKIEDKLYAHEPYLAQLLKLDSIGAHVLSQEKEKQLRSHLELEIFRRLQMGRQETDGGAPGGDTLSLSNTVPTALTSLPLVATDLVAEMTSKGHGNSVKPNSPTCPLQHPIRLPPNLHNEGRSGLPGALCTQHRMPFDRESRLQEMNADESRTHICLEAEPRHAESKMHTHADGTAPSLHHGGADSLAMWEALGGRAVPTVAMDYDVKCKTGRQGSCHQRSKSSIVGGRFSATPWTDAVHISGAEHMSKAHSADTPSTGVERAGSLRVASRPRYPDSASAMADKADLQSGVRKHPPDLTYPVGRADSLREASRKHGEPSCVGVERADSLRLSGKRHVTDVAGFGVERADSLRLTGKKPELPPKPTFAQSKLPSLDNKHSPKATPLKLPVERALHRGEASCSLPLGPGGVLCGSGPLGESSSGSEPDAGHLPAGLASAVGGRRPQVQGRRNLRKTKSRGKGKGSGTISPTLMLDELSLAVPEPLPGEELSVSVQIHHPPSGHKDIADDAM